MTRRTYPFEERWWKEPEHRVRRGWKKRDEFGVEHWVEDSTSTLDVRSSFHDQDLSGFEEGNNSGLKGGGGGSENNHSTQSQGGQMKEDIDINENTSTAEYLNTKSSHTSENYIPEEIPVVAQFLYDARAVAYGDHRR